MSTLRARRCLPCDGLTEKLERARAEALLAELHPAWTLGDSADELSREFEFGDFHQTMAFVNAVAYIAHAEDHHPNLDVGWGHCVVRYSTHAIEGLSENDFICAALIDALPSLA
ncbi:MAG: 4a-hydroxytetrahydrobiopterin dehydratase [Gammaproteobacteria bacterium]|nr:4a-hydroxytetrahydrobiopterin dehydratase [Gammaproteobacteria bacterium]MCP5137057.1 4a-hydroxytetrahydrobiopterin dehydratase [Gammaproteobacteria bacterium]